MIEHIIADATRLFKQFPRHFRCFALPLFVPHIHPRTISVRKGARFYEWENGVELFHGEILPCKVKLRLRRRYEQDKERADLPTGVYIDVHDLGEMQTQQPCPCRAQNGVDAS